MMSRNYVIQQDQRKSILVSNARQGSDYMFDDPRIMWWLHAAAYVLFAAVGGIMGYLMRTIDNGNKISWPRATLEGGSAAFVGFITMLLCQTLGMSAQWTGVVVGVSGWLGASVSIRMLELVVRKKLGLDSEEEIQPEVNEETGDA
jgi:predicted membrane protein